MKWKLLINCKNYLMIPRSATTLHSCQVSDYPYFQGTILHFDTTSQQSISENGEYLEYTTTLSIQG